jgi:dGTPase
VIGEILREIAIEHPRIDHSRRVYELLRRLITRMIEDVIAQTERNVAALGLVMVQDVREAGQPVVRFSAAMAEADRAIKGFLYPRLYRHERIMRIMGEAERVVRELFSHYVAHPDDLPPEWSSALDRADRIATARRIADFIAGMTDRYAMVEHTRLFGATPELR